jgi:ubiquinone/menaquinone biosynthesis C-methylase UbiE
VKIKQGTSPPAPRLRRAGKPLKVSANLRLCSGEEEKFLIFMSKKFLKAEWDKIAEQWHKEVGKEGIWHQKHDIDPVIFKLLGNVRGKKILEIGAGNGYFSRLLAKKGAKVVATDIAPKLIFFAKKEEENNPLGIEYFVRNAADLCEVKNKSFDAVVANMCLMDIADAEKAIKEASRVLKKNGRFVFSVTHPAFSDFRQYWTIAKQKGKKYFARVVLTYLSSSAEKFVFPIAGIKKFEATQYHRSIDTYFSYLKEVEFLVSDFREIATKKPVAKADFKKDGDVTLRRSKYNKALDKKMKELAGREIPLFLIIGSIKYS